MFLWSFSCPADHVPDWQPRIILLGMVEARSVNVNDTTTTIMLTQCYLHRGTCLNAMKRFYICSLWSHLNVLTFFPHIAGGCSEGLGAFWFFFKNSDKLGASRMCIYVYSSLGCLSRGGSMSVWPRYCIKWYSSSCYKKMVTLLYLVFTQSTPIIVSRQILHPNRKILFT